MCLHAASLNAAERSSGSVTTPARPARAEAMEQEAVAAEEKAEAWGKAAISSKNASAVSMIREEALQTASGVSTLEMELKDKVEEAERELREQQQQRALLSVRDAFNDFGGDACVRLMDRATLERNRTKRGVWY